MFGREGDAADIEGTAEATGLNKDRIFRRVSFFPVRRIMISRKAQNNHRGWLPVHCVTHVWKLIGGDANKCRNGI